MKNFKYPLAINGTKEELESIANKLIELGYVWDTTYCEWSGHEPWLLTQFGFNSIGFNQSPSNHYIVNASNPDLVIALAAMVDDNIFYEEEIVKFLPRNLDWCRKVSGKGNCDIFTVTKNTGRSNYLYVKALPNAECQSPNHYKQHFRKATKEEIIQHFTKNDMTFNQPNEVNGFQPLPTTNSSTEKEIIGWKVKDGIDEESACGLICCTHGKSRMFENINFQVDSAAHGKAISLGILNQLFEPVYKQPQYKAGDWVAIVDLGRASHNTVYPKALKLSRDFSKENGFYFYVEGCIDDGWPNAFDLGIKIRTATQQEIDESRVRIITLQCTGGTFEIEVSKKGIYYRAEDKWLDESRLKYIISHNPWGNEGYHINTYKFTPIMTHIDSGCKKNVPISDWKKVLDAYDALK